MVHSPGAAMIQFPRPGATDGPRQPSAVATGRFGRDCLWSSGKRARHGRGLIARASRGGFNGAHGRRRAGLDAQGNGRRAGRPGDVPSDHARLVLGRRCRGKPGTGVRGGTRQGAGDLHAHRHARQPPRGAGACRRARPRDRAGREPPVQRCRRLRAAAERHSAGPTRCRPVGFHPGRGAAGHGPDGKPAGRRARVGDLDRDAGPAPVRRDIRCGRA